MRPTPANTPGVIFGVSLATVMVAMGFVLGWDDTTRKGIPVWLLSSVGAACFVGVAVQCWRKPREEAAARSRVKRSAIYGAITIVAVVIVLVVSVIR